MSDVTILQEFGLRDVGDKEIGIEIEMEGERIAHHPPNGWLLHEDGSLRGDAQAVEYVFNGPVERQRKDALLTTLQKFLKEKNANISDSDRAGVHVHINCQHMTTSEVINFGLLYLMFEDMMLKFCGESREGNLFCLSAKDAEFIVEGLLVARRRNSLHNMQNNNYRYASVNFSSLSKYGSVEFRAMRTPKDFGLISVWSDMLLSIKDASRQFKDPRDLIETISAGSVEEFVRSVFGIHTDLIYGPHLDQLILESARLIQPVAYTKPNPVYKNKKKKKAADAAPARELREALQRANRAYEWRNFGGAEPGREVAPPPPEAPMLEEDF